jgi:SP family arabinose:H+ symporter-like MFS transporter
MLSVFGQLSGVNIVVYYGPKILAAAGYQDTAALAVLGALFLFGTRSAGPGEAVVVSKAVGLWIGLMICVYMACIALSICAVIWVLTPDIFPNRVRGRAASIATLANWSTNALSAQLFPWYSAHLGKHAAFFTSAAICTVATLFFWKYVPETKRQSLEEIESCWRR